MAANGISTLADKADRKTAKLALAQTKRETADVTVEDGSVVWTDFGTDTQVGGAWSAETAYALNDIIGPFTFDGSMGGRYFKATTGGTSGTIEPTWVATPGYRPKHTLNLALPWPTEGRPWE